MARRFGFGYPQFVLGSNDLNHSMSDNDQFADFLNRKSDIVLMVPPSPSDHHFTQTKAYIAKEMQQLWDKSGENGFIREGQYFTVAYNGAGGQPTYSKALKASEVPEFLRTLPNHGEGSTLEASIRALSQTGRTHKGILAFASKLNHDQADSLKQAAKDVGIPVIGVLHERRPFNVANDHKTKPEKKYNPDNFTFWSKEDGERVKTKRAYGNGSEGYTNYHDRKKLEAAMQGSGVYGGALRMEDVNFKGVDKVIYALSRPQIRDHAIRNNLPVPEMPELKAFSGGHYKTHSTIRVGRNIFIPAADKTSKERIHDFSESDVFKRLVARASEPLPADVIIEDTPNDPWETPFSLSDAFNSAANPDRWIGNYNNEFKNKSDVARAFAAKKVNGNDKPVEAAQPEKKSWFNPEWLKGSWKKAVAAAVATGLIITFCTDRKQEDAPTAGADATPASIPLARFKEPTAPVIYFGPNSYKVSDADKVILEEYASYIAESEGKNITLEGHADSPGTKKQNKAAAGKRIDNVKEIFLAKGVMLQQIDVDNKGEEGAPNTGSNKDWRRVNVIVVEPLSDEQREFGREP